jgi:hypothetical protein
MENGVARRSRRSGVPTLRAYVNAVDDGASTRSPSPCFMPVPRDTVQCKNSLVFSVTRVCAEIVPLHQVTN